MTEEASVGVPARRTRRQLLAGGTGALAAVLTAEALARPAPAQAANGSPLILGQANDESQDTILNNTSPGDAVLILHPVGNGTGVEADADSGTAVGGLSNSGTGVAGTGGPSNGTGVVGTGSGDGDGVMGTGGANGGDGVRGGDNDHESSLVRRQLITPETWAGRRVWFDERHLERETSADPCSRFKNAECLKTPRPRPLTSSETAVNLPPASPMLITIPITTRTSISALGKARDGAESDRGAGGRHDRRPR